MDGMIKYIPPINKASCGVAKHEAVLHERPHRFTYTSDYGVLMF